MKKSYIGALIITVGLFVILNITNVISMKDLFKTSDNSKQLSQEANVAKIAPIDSVKYECNDGLDNDTDGLIDYPADPGCSSYIDNTEANKPIVCTDKCTPPSCVIDSFVSNPSTISAGSTSSLSWSSTDGCALRGFINNITYTPPLAANGTLTTGVLNQTTTFTLYAGTPITGCTSFSGNSLTTGQPCTTGTQSATTTVIVTPVVSSCQNSSARIFFMGGITVPTGSHNDVWCSLNMTSWGQILPDLYQSPPRWTSRPLFNSPIYFNNKVWVLGNRETYTASNDVWSSSNGVTWTQSPDASWSKRNSFGTVVFNNKMWVIGGQTYNSISGNYDQLNDVWSSTDGTSWVQATPNAPWSKRNSLKVLNFNNKMWVISGNNSTVGISDVWSSTDGTSWVQATPNAFLPRGYHTATVFKGKMWVIGGSAGSGGLQYDDVLSSSDGITWTTSVAHAPWGKISGHSTVVWNNKIWLLAGVRHDTNNNVYNTAIWSSTDGVTWTQEVANAPWVKRFYQAVVVTP